MQKQWVSRQATILYCFRGDCTDCNMTLTLVSQQTKKDQVAPDAGRWPTQSCLTPAICNTGKTHFGLVPLCPLHPTPTQNEIFGAKVKRLLQGMYVIAKVNINSLQFYIPTEGAFFLRITQTCKEQKKNCEMLNSIRVKYSGFIIWFSVATLISIHQRYLQKWF